MKGKLGSMISTVTSESGWVKDGFFALLKVVLEER